MPRRSAAPRPGARMARVDTLCDRMLSGRIANVVPDVASAPGARGATASPGVGAYVGVPVRLADGTRLRLALLRLRRSRRRTLRDRDARLLEVLARIIADQIDRERQQRRYRAAGGRGERRPGAARRAEGARALHRRALRGRGRARDGGRARSSGLPDDEVVEVAQVALLHDVGKLGVPEAILQKPGALTDAEWRIMRSHPAIGERVVALDRVARASRARRPRRARALGRHRLSRRARRRPRSRSPAASASPATPGTR